MGIMFLLTALFLKHFVVDFLLQPPYMYLNKGTLTHLGGWLHAGLHGLATLAILALIVCTLGTGSSVMFAYISLLSLAEVFIHYGMDYVKVNVCRKNGYTPTTHEEWFTWLGIDQTVHSLTYILIAAMML